MKAREIIDNLQRYWHQGLHFVRNDLWYKPLPPWNTLNGLGFRLTRFLHLTYKGLREDDIRLHTSSLTYSTLMSLLPLLALVLAISNGLGYDLLSVERISGYLEEMPAQFQDFVQKALDTVGNTDFAKLGGIGGAFLLFLVIQVLSTIENSFNRVWNVARNRRWLRKITNYISIAVVVPVLLLAGITILANVKTGGVLFKQLGLLRAAPFLATWAAFSFLYKAMPNTHVKFWAAAVSGFGAAIVWQLWLRFYIAIQPGVTRYNLLYGTLAFVPIFLAWLYVNWAIVLIGAKVAFAVQNGNTYQPELSRREANIHAKILLALAVLVRAAQALENQKPSLEKDTFAKQHAVNPYLLDHVITLLIEARLLAYTDGENTYLVLLKNPHKVTMREVSNLFLDHGDPASKLGFKNLDTSLRQFEKIVPMDLFEQKQTIGDLLAENPA